MSLRAGFAKIDVTPVLGSGADTVGFGQLENPPCQGIESRLYARGMSMLCVGEDTATTIVVCDCLVIPNELNERLVSACADDCFSPRKTRLVLCATHTHSAPIVQDLFGMSVVEDKNYLPTLEAGILEAARASLSNMVPACIMARHDQLTGWAFNRRFVMCDGNIETQ